MGIGSDFSHEYKLIQFKIFRYCVFYRTMGDLSIQQAVLVSVFHRWTLTWAKPDVLFFRDLTSRKGKQEREGDTGVQQEPCGILALEPVFCRFQTDGAARGFDHCALPRHAWSLGAGSGSFGGQLGVGVGGRQDCWDCGMRFWGERVGR